ncbi:MAG: alpha/beta hydrolase [Clostridia bacterium]|nr:alpha/beta hydrolase [Clostridia bacterium]
MSIMEYVKLGKGPKAFVLISGIGMNSVLSSAEAVGSMYARFLKDYTLYLFDRSMEIPDDVTISDFASDTVLCLRNDNVDSAIFVGMSQGGMIAQQIALDYPSMVTKLVVCSSSSGPNAISNTVLTYWCALAEKCDVKALNNSLVDLIYSEVTKTQFGEYFKAHENDGTPEQCKRFVALLNSSNEFDCRERLKEIKCPVLVLGSMQDKVLGAEGSLKTAEILGCSVYMYEGYGHAVYDEAKDFLDKIEEFLLQ